MFVPAAVSLQGFGVPKDWSLAQGGVNATRKSPQ